MRTYYSSLAEVALATRPVDELNSRSHAWCTNRWPEKHKSIWFPIFSFLPTLAALSFEGGYVTQQLRRHKYLCCWSSCVERFAVILSTTEHELQTFQSITEST